MERWFKHGLRFECQNCGTCCGGEPGFIFVTEVEIDSIKNITGLSESDFIKRTRYGKSIKEMDNYDCQFLKDCKCEIYSKRPLQCRRFPFWDTLLISPERWESATKFCPGINKGPLFTETEILKRMILLLSKES